MEQRRSENSESARCRFRRHVVSTCIISRGQRPRGSTNHSFCHNLKYDHRLELRRNPISSAPDSNLSVGPTQVVQIVNSLLALFSSDGSVIYGPKDHSVIFTNLGGICDGDGKTDFASAWPIHACLRSAWILSRARSSVPLGYMWPRGLLQHLSERYRGLLRPRFRDGQELAYTGQLELELTRA